MFALVVLCSFIGASAFQAGAGRASTRTTLSMINEDRSIALPYEKRPAALDGALAGDVGFDPAGFTNNPPKQWLIGGEDRSLKWYREAEIVHGRVAQLAVVGNLVPNWLHFPGGALGVSEGAYSEVNPLKALNTVPSEALWQIALVIFGIELARTKRVIQGDKEPGDLGLGQTGYNPFNFNYSAEEYREKQIQEIKHGRLAMFGSIGMLLQNSISGNGVVQQLANSFEFPDERAYLIGPGAMNDFFPPNL